jgi:hypothetical protein
MHTTLEETPMSRSTEIAMIRAAQACVREAQHADRTGQHHYAELLRASARTALDALDAATPKALDPAAAKSKEQAQAYAKVISAGFGARS